MKVLAIDGGAERLGWAILDRKDNQPVYIDSGVCFVPRKGKVFQEYRLELIHFYFTQLSLFEDIEEMVNEIVPAVGTFGGVQMYLANVAVSVLQTIAIGNGISVYQIGATTVQSKIAIGRTGKKTSKAQVRNGVIQLLPELSARKKDWTKIWEEPDAIAIGLAHLGFSNEKVNDSKSKRRTKA